MEPRGRTVARPGRRSFSIALLTVVAALSCSAEPTVTPEEAISSLCLHLQGLTVPAVDVSSVDRRMDALGVDVELLRAADRPDLAAEVRDVIDSIDASSEQISVFLTDVITAPEREAIRARLDEIPGIRDVRFETKAAAAKRFREMFKDSPMFLENVDEESVLPESWRAVAAAGDLDGVDTDLRRMPGVRQVSIGPMGLDEAIGKAMPLHVRVCSPS
jgi:hypothetical protein